MALYSDDHHTTALRCPQALATARQIGDPWAMARATNVGCYVSLWTDPARARAQLARSIESARDSGDNWGELDGLKMMTIAYQVEDDHEGASPYFDQLHATAQRLGNTHPKPVRADGTAARHLPQVQIIADRLAGTRVRGTDSRHGQVELVGRVRA